MELPKTIPVKFTFTARWEVPVARVRVKARGASPTAQVRAQMVWWAPAVFWVIRAIHATGLVKIEVETGAHS